MKNLRNDKYLIFKLDKQNFGISIEMVKEVFKAHKVYSLPRTSEIILGVVNLRGRIITIFDLKKLIFKVDLLNEEVESKTSKTKEYSIILINIGNQDVGLFVDHILSLQLVKEYEKVKKEDINSFNSAITSSIKEIGKIEKESVHLINIDKMIENYLVLDEDKLSSSYDDFDDFDYSQYTLNAQPEDMEQIEGEGSLSEEEIEELKNEHESSEKTNKKDVSSKEKTEAEKNP